MLVRDGELVSSLTILQGRKHHAEPLPCGGTIMADNVMAEFTTIPQDHKNGFRQSIRESLTGLHNKVQAHGCSLFAIPSASFPKSELKSDEAKQFGCDPDYDAWTCKLNKFDERTAKRTTLRVAGAHVHVGHPIIRQLKDKPPFVKVLDSIPGLASVIIDNHDDSKRRREMYGKAGAHRPKDYGVEYRVPSNFWVSKPILVDLMYDLFHASLETFSLTRERIVDEIGQETLVNTINSSDYTQAVELFKSVVVRYIGEGLTSRVLEASVSENDRNIAASWNL